MIGPVTRARATPYIIAEVGSTHDGSLGNALRAIEVFAACGANAIKYQDHRWQEIADDAQHPAWFQGAPAESRAAYIARTCFERWQWEHIAGRCAGVGVDLIVSPFSAQAARELATYVDAFKIASGQVENMRLLDEIRQSGKLVFVSSGLAEPQTSMFELCITMSCTSAYPCPPEHVWHNPSYRGYSDHTQSHTAAVMLLDRGVEYFEKHVTLSRELYGSDARYAAEPEQFRSYCATLREASIIKRALESGEKFVDPQIKREFLWQNTSQ